MSCKIYQGMCNCCKNFVKTTSVTVSGNTLVLAIPQATYNDGDKVCVCIAQAIPTYAGTVNEVAIQIGSASTTYNILTEDAEYVNPNNIRARRVYHLRAAATSQLFRVCKKELCGCTYTNNTIPQATAEASQTAQIK